MTDTMYCQISKEEHEKMIKESEKRLELLCEEYLEITKKAIEEYKYGKAEL